MVNEMQRWFVAKEAFSNGSGFFFSPPLALSPSMEMINGIAHKVNSTREIAFYLWWTYLSPVVVNLSSWDPVRRQRRRVQTPPSLPRPCAKVLTSKSLVTFFFLSLNAPKISLFISSKMKSKAHWQGKRKTSYNIQHFKYAHLVFFFITNIYFSHWRRCSNWRQGRSLSYKFRLQYLAQDSDRNKGKSKMTSSDISCSLPKEKSSLEPVDSQWQGQVISASYLDPAQDGWWLTAARQLHVCHPHSTNCPTAMSFKIHTYWYVEVRLCAKKCNFYFT